MIKECKVILHNEAVTVVDYDGKNIQFPSIAGDSKTVFVKCENGEYSICDGKEDVKETAVKKTAQKKKATVEETTESAEEITENAEN